LENIVTKIGFKTVSLLKAADDESIVSSVVTSNG